MAETLRSLHRYSLEDYDLVLTRVRRGRFPEECDFELRLEAPGEAEVSQPVIEGGKYFAGRIPLLVPWCEFTYRPVVRFLESGRTADLSGTRSEERLFAILTGLLPAGGRMFVDYGEEAGEVTSRSLKREVPAPLTPLGYLMWRSGFRWFKDWYYSEGWREGGQKIQGTLPLNEDVRRQREEEIHAEIRGFLAELSREEASIETEIRSRAEEILSAAGGPSSDVESKE